METEFLERILSFQEAEGEKRSHPGRNQVLKILKHT